MEAQCIGVRYVVNPNGIVATLKRSAMLLRSNERHPSAAWTSRDGARRPLAPAEYEALAAFRYALRHFLSFSETAAAEVGLASQQYQALLAIRGASGRDSVTINELAKLLLIKHNSAVGLVDRLESEGLVRRSVAPEDRRKVNVRLTRKGVRVFERLATAHRDELRRIGPELTEFFVYFSQQAPSAKQHDR